MWCGTLLLLVRARMRSALPRPPLQSSPGVTSAARAGAHHNSQPN
jgi:hypothetical protein